MSAEPTLQVVSGALEPQAKARELLPMVVVGGANSGKSTLIGCLLQDTGVLPEGKHQELQAAGRLRDMRSRWSPARAASEATGEQALAGDITQVGFRSAQRDYVIVDAAGHRELLENVIGADLAVAAGVLVIDAHEGVRQKTKCYGDLLRLLGIEQVAVAVNKMDLVDYAESRFAAVAEDVSAYLREIGVDASAVVPVSAQAGGNIASRSAHMPWYAGPTVVEALDAFAAPRAALDQALRFSVQNVRKLDGRRVIAGRVETGVLRVGDRLLFSPSDKTAHVTGIESLNQEPPPLEAKAGQSIGLTLDEQVFVERGNVASPEDDPPILTTVFRATVLWHGESPLTSGQALELKLPASEAPVRVQSIDRVNDANDLSRLSSDRVERNQVAEITLRSRVILALDEYATRPQTGRCALIDDDETVAEGLINMEGYPDQRGQFTIRSTNITAVEHRVTQGARSGRNGHRGGVLWFTGLSGAGKSTLAMALEQLLFAKGYHTYVLDGDNVRRGLNADLGFSPEERAENIRRVGEVAALFADAGFIVITAFISPYQSDRDRARQAGPDKFHEIYVKADLETCEKRDPKGLYRKARSGEISDFTGISAPYQEPSRAELVVDTSAASVEGCLDSLVDYVEAEFALERQARRVP